MDNLPVSVMVEEWAREMEQEAEMKAEDARKTETETKEETNIGQKVEMKEKTDEKQETEVKQDTEEKKEIETKTDEESHSAQYGGLIGPNAKYLKLVSGDGLEFILLKEYAMQSTTLKAMMSGPGELGENEENEIQLPMISAPVLQKVCTYLIFKSYYTGNTKTIPDFPIEREIALDVLLAANFLGC